MKQVDNYTYSNNPDVANAERAWLQAIDDKLGHATVNDRWNVVVRMRELAQTNLFHRKIHNTKH